MSIQVTAAPGALVALGLGVSDVSTLVALGRRVGNWWTAADGDKEFLSLLEEDASSILQRRGLLDVPAFNKRWSKQIQLLAKGSPLRLEGRDIEQVLKDSKPLLQVSFDRLSATPPHTDETGLVSFHQRHDLPCRCAGAVRQTGSCQRHPIQHAQVSLKPHENGEDILRSQYSSTPKQPDSPTRTNPRHRCSHRRWKPRWKSLRGTLPSVIGFWVYFESRNRDRARKLPWQHPHERSVMALDCH